MKRLKDLEEINENLLKLNGDLLQLLLDLEDNEKEIKIIHGISGEIGKLQGIIILEKIDYKHERY